MTPAPLAHAPIPPHPPTPRLARARRLAALARYAAPVLAAMAAGHPPGSPTVARRLARACERAGGAVHKAGQLLATRPDLLGEPARRALARLCDDTAPDPIPRVIEQLRSSVSPAALARIAGVDPVPIGCGSVAQVHLARLAGRPDPVVLKIRRPGAPARFRTDLAIAGVALRRAARLPRLRGYPLVPGFGRIAGAVAAQLDFVAEAGTQTYFHRVYAGHPALVVPAVIAELSGPGVIAMEHVAAAVRIDDPALPAPVARRALRTALHVLYEMIFEHGLVHCDPHPGNLLVTGDGRLALIDYGYTATLTAADRHALARLFLALAVNDPAAAAEVVVETSVPAGGTARRDRRDPYESVAADLDAVIGTASRADAASFGVAGFALALFEVQRRHRLTGRPDLVMAVLALLSLEGLVKTHLPGLDFQREAIGHVTRALAGGPGPVG